MQKPRVPSPPPRIRVLSASNTHNTFSNAAPREEGGDPLSQRIVANPAKQHRKREPNSGSFQTGTSGNVRGRPRGSKGVKVVVSKALSTRITIQTPRGPKKVEILEALIKKELSLAAGPFKLIRCRPSANKVDRLLAQTGQIEEGRVFLPAERDGLDGLLSELRAFPHGRHDDQVDSLTQMLEYALSHWKSVATRYTSTGRKVRILRENSRPPLPPLPRWIV